MRENSDMTIVISTRGSFRILLILWSILLGASILANLLMNYKSDHYLINEAVESYIRMFSLDKEANIPTWFSSLLLFIASVALTFISLLVSRAGERYVLHWAFLAVLFLGMSMDESALIHEMLVKAMTLFFHATGYLYYGWIIPGALFVIGVGLAYLRFVLSLPLFIRLLIMAAGLIYILGALGFESISGKIDEMYGQSGFVYYSITTLEEGCEMLGVIIFIFALFQYLADNFGGFQLSVRPGSSLKALSVEKNSDNLATGS